MSVQDMAGGEAEGMAPTQGPRRDAGKASPRQGQGGEAASWRTPPALLVAKRDAEASWRMLFLACLGLCAVAYIVAWSFPEFRDRLVQMGKGVPKWMRNLLEARSQQSLSQISLESFVGLGYRHPVAMALFALWPITRAVRAVAGDLDRGALGWMLAYPVGRVPFLLARAFVMLAGVLVMQIAMLLFVRGWAGHFQLEIAGWLPYWKAAAGGALLYGAVGSLTLWASALSRRMAPPAYVGAALVLGSLIFNNANEQLPLPEATKWLSLFHYFNVTAVLKGAPLGAFNLAVLTGLLVLGLVGACVGFQRRDLPI